MKTMRRSWSESEIHAAITRTDLSARELGEVLGRTKRSVEQMRIRLFKEGRISEPIVTDSKINPWTPDEDAIVARHTGSLSSAQIAVMLPGRTPTAVKLRRQRLGLPDAPPGDTYAPTRPGKRTVVARTCTDCGRLLQHEEFSKLKSGVTDCICRDCRAERRTKWAERNVEHLSQYQKARDYTPLKQKEYQAQTLENASRNGQPYTEQDFKVLADPTLTVLEKALKTNRTFVAVRFMCHTNGFQAASMRETIPRPDGNWLINNPNEGAAV